MDKVKIDYLNYLPRRSIYSRLIERIKRARAVVQLRSIRSKSTINLASFRYRHEFVVTIIYRRSSSSSSSASASMSSVAASLPSSSSVLAACWFPLPSWFMFPATTSEEKSCQEDKASRLTSASRRSQISVSRRKTQSRLKDSLSGCVATPIMARNRYRADSVTG